MALDKKHHTKRINTIYKNNKTILNNLNVEQDNGIIKFVNSTIGEPVEKKKQFNLFKYQYL